MQPKVKNIEKWVKALRSGKYKQGSSYLARDDNDGVVKYCCLGVACELALQDGVQMRVNREDDGSYSYSKEEAMLPFRVQQWLGIDQANPIVLGSPNAPYPFRATHVNDIKDWSFKKIAAAVAHTFLGKPLPKNFEDMK